MKSLIFVLSMALAQVAWGLVPGLSPQGTKCPVCRMTVTPSSKTVYSSRRDSGEKAELVHYCSYSCAHAFHHRKPDSPLFTHDFETGDSVSSADAWYVVKSKKIDNEVDFAMAPIVVSFADEARAKAFQLKLGDGKVVQGWKAVEQTYQK